MAQIDPDSNMSLSELDQWLAIQNAGLPENERPVIQGAPEEMAETRYEEEPVQEPEAGPRLAEGVTATPSGKFMRGGKFIPKAQAYAPVP